MALGDLEKKQQKLIGRTLEFARRFIFVSLFHPLAGPGNTSQLLYCRPLPLIIWGWWGLGKPKRAGFSWLDFKHCPSDRRNKWRPKTGILTNPFLLALPSFHYTVQPTTTPYIPQQPAQHHIFHPTTACSTSHLSFHNSLPNITSFIPEQPAQHHIFHPTTACQTSHLSSSNSLKPFPTSYWLHHTSPYIPVNTSSLYITSSLFIQLLQTPLLPVQLWMKVDKV